MDKPLELPIAIKHLLMAPIERRVDWVMADAWVHTRTTSAAFQWMAYLYRSGPVIRPPCLQIIAEGGMGKTAALLAFAAQYPVQQDAEDPLRYRRPVLYVECKPDNSGVFGVRHSILKAAWPNATQFSCSEGEIDSTLRAQGVRLLLLDELGELTKAGNAAHRKALSELKRISNETRVRMVAATVSNLAHVLDVDQQFASRFKRKIKIPPWSLSQELRDFVFGLERNLPFPRRSYLYEREYLPLIAQHAEGNTKEIVELIRLAALHALTTDAPCIEASHLDLALNSEMPPGIVLSAVA